MKKDELHRFADTEISFKIFIPACDKKNNIYNFTHDSYWEQRVGLW